ncbi:MAG: DUF4255 domain-containing protein [Desulfosarcinaceae bacterium]|nr:DUF4255 domain-containing protein [Desulfosarcinaceae bacterium]
MSAASALAGITAVLQNLIASALRHHESALGQIKVTSLAPEQMAGKKNHLHLFLFQAAENPALRNHWQPARDAVGEAISRQPLCLDLGYLLSAYSDKELHAELMLGAAMQIFHETPVLTRKMLVDATAQLAADNIRDPRLTTAIEQFKISPWTLKSEDLSRIWSALQAPYRMTMAYRISVVLIDPDLEARHPLPVLRRGAADRGPKVHLMGQSAYPFLERIVLPQKGRLAVETGETIRLHGRGFSGQAAQVVFQHPLLASPVNIPQASFTEFDDAQIALKLPNDSDPWRAGTYRLHVAVQSGADTGFHPSNELPLQVAPRITGPPTAEVVDADADAPRTVFLKNLTCSPRVAAEQQAFLIVGDRSVAAVPRSSSSSTLDFGPTDLPNGTYRYHLRVDGVDSIFINYASTPPSFIDQTVEIDDGA